MNRDIEYLMKKYLNSNGNTRLYKQLILVLECDLIYHTIEQRR